MIRLNNILKEWLNEIKYTPDQAVKILSKFGIRNADRLSDDELKKQFRKIAFKHHPDAGGKHEDFIQINAAYETLTQHLKPVQNSTDDSGTSTSDDDYGYSSDDLKALRKRATEVKKVFDVINADSRFTDLTKGKDPAIEFFISDLNAGNQRDPYLKTLFINLFDNKGGMARIHVFYDTEENKYVASSVGTIPGAGGEYNSIDDMVNDIYKILIAWLAKYRKPKK
jgi:hypothetical protein